MPNLNMAEPQICSGFAVAEPFSGELPDALVNERSSEHISHRDDAVSGSDQQTDNNVRRISMGDRKSGEKNDPECVPDGYHFPDERDASIQQPPRETHQNNPDGHTEETLAKKSHREGMWLL